MNAENADPEAIKLKLDQLKIDQLAVRKGCLRPLNLHWHSSGG